METQVSVISPTKSLTTKGCKLCICNTHIFYYMQKSQTEVMQNWSTEHLKAVRISAATMKWSNKLWHSIFEKHTKYQYEMHMHLKVNIKHMTYSTVAFLIYGRNQHNLILVFTNWMDPNNLDKQIQQQFVRCKPCCNNVNRENETNRLATNHCMDK